MPFEYYLYHTLLTTLIFTFIFFYIRCYKLKIATVIMFLFILFDILNFYVESPLIPKISIVIRTITYALLSVLIMKKINLRPKNYAMFSVIAILNGYLIYLLVSSVDISKFNTIDIVFVVIPSIVMIFMCICSANYNFNRFHLRSTLFMLATFCFAFADITLFCGYYLEIEALFYLERFFAVSAFLTFVNYTMLENKKRAQNSVKNSVYYY